jgi:hypothetical protein
VLPAEAESTGFPYARSIVRSLTEPLDAESGREAQTREWISSLDLVATGAQRFGQLVRGQWNIENGTHRQRDVLWREDHQRMKNHTRAHILASLRQVALWQHVRLRKQRSATVKPGAEPTPISHSIQRLSHNPAAAFPLILKDQRE